MGTTFCAETRSSTSEIRSNLISYASAFERIPVDSLPCLCILTNKCHHDTVLLRIKPPPPLESNTAKSRFRCFFFFHFPRKVDFGVLLFTTFQILKRAQFAKFYFINSCFYLENRIFFAPSARFSLTKSIFKFEKR